MLLGLLRAPRVPAVENDPLADCIVDWGASPSTAWQALALELSPIMAIDALQVRRAWAQPLRSLPDGAELVVGVWSRPVGPASPPAAAALAKDCEAVTLSARLLLHLRETHDMDDPDCMQFERRTLVFIRMPATGDNTLRTWAMRLAYAMKQEHCEVRALTRHSTAALLEHLHGMASPEAFNRTAHDLEPAALGFTVQNHEERGLLTLDAHLQGLLRSSSLPVESWVFSRIDSGSPTAELSALSASRNPAAVPARDLLMSGERLLRQRQGVLLRSPLTETGARAAVEVQYGANLQGLAIREVRGKRIADFRKDALPWSVENLVLATKDGAFKTVQKALKSGELVSSQEVWRGLCHARGWQGRRHTQGMLGVRLHTVSGARAEFVPQLGDKGSPTMLITGAAGSGASILAHELVLGQCASGGSAWVMSIGTAPSLPHVLDFKRIVLDRGHAASLNPFSLLHEPVQGQLLLQALGNRPMTRQQALALSTIQSQVDTLLPAFKSWMCAVLGLTTGNLGMPAMTSQTEIALEMALRRVMLEQGSHGDILDVLALLDVEGHRELVLWPERHRPGGRTCLDSSGLQRHRAPDTDAVAPHRPAPQGSSSDEPHAGSRLHRRVAQSRLGTSDESLPSCDAYGQRKRRGDFPTVARPRRQADD